MGYLWIYLFDPFPLVILLGAGIGRISATLPYPFLDLFGVCGEQNWHPRQISPAQLLALHRRAGLHRSAAPPEVPGSRVQLGKVRWHPTWWQMFYGFYGLDQIL